MLKDRYSEGATARLRNGKWGARETCFEQWSLTRLQCSLWYHLVESGQPRGKECRSPRPPPRLTYWVLHIQKMLGSRGSPCITVSIPHDDGRNYRPKHVLVNAINKWIQNNLLFYWPENNKFWPPDVLLRNLCNYIRLMSQGHSLTTHQMLCILIFFLSQTRSRLTLTS